MPRTPAVDAAADPQSPKHDDDSTQRPTQVGAAPTAAGSSPADRGRGLPMPHERDESSGGAGTQHQESPDPVIEQAHRDLADGLVDTDMRAPSGLDAEQRRKLMSGGTDPAAASPTSSRR